jgi:hypothetical protein
MCNTIRTLNNKTRTDTQIKFYKALTAPTLIYGSEIWSRKRRKETKIKTAEMKMLKSVTGYTRKAPK